MSSSSVNAASLRARVAEQENTIRELALRAQHLEGQMDILVKQQDKPNRRATSSVRLTRVPVCRHRINSANSGSSAAGASSAATSSTSGKRS
jgi:hypothetical protein